MDIEKFGDLTRTNSHRYAIRHGLYAVLRRALTGAKIAWTDCTIEDRGDGALILIPANVPKNRLSTALPSSLTAALRRYNAACSFEVKIRLRMALHAGEVRYDNWGVVGSAINHTFRLLEASTLKDTFASSTGTLALIASAWFYEEVIQHDPDAAPSAYRQCQVKVKETNSLAWIRFPDNDPPPRVSRSKFLGNFTDQTNDLPVAVAHTVAKRDERVDKELSVAVCRTSWHPTPAQLPHDIRNFTGRELELTQLNRLTEGSDGRAIPLATIEGPAGIGKTALAIHFGHRVATRFPDGQIYLNLQGFDPTHYPMPPTQALGHLLRGIGIAPQQVPSNVDDQSAMYRSMLAHRRVLVILDNVASVEQVRPLLPGSPSSLVVVTSRNRLHGLVARDGARRITLPALSPLQALALMIGIVGKERVERELDEAKLITRHCDYLPLALRVAAERISSRKFSALSDLASDFANQQNRLYMLDVPNDELTSVRAAVSWSYRALSSDSKRAFRLLGLHTGTDISRTALAALTNVSAVQAAHLLDNLSNAHLIEQTAEDRYRLHDLLRSFAVDRADEEESATGRREAINRIRSWYLFTCYAATQKLSPTRRLSLDPPGTTGHFLDFNNHITALHWCESELNNLLLVSLDAAAAKDHITTWQLSVILSSLFRLRKHWVDWMPIGYAGLNASRAIHDTIGEAWCLNSLGSAYTDLHRLTESFAYLQKALTIFRKTGDQRGIASSIIALAYAFWRDQRLDEALNCNQQYLTLTRESNDRYAESHALNNVGEMYRELRRYPEALDHLQQSLAMCRDVGNLRGEGNALSNLGATYREIGLPQTAVTYFQRALNIRRETGDQWGVAWTLHRLGKAKQDIGKLAEVRQYWENSLAIFRNLGDQQAVTVYADLNAL